MNREIKFRVWTGLEMEYRVVVGNLGAFYASGIDPNDSACIGTTTRYYKETPVMQYTGLKDKNGKEIYEGDIVMRHEKFCLGRICQVVFQMGSFELHCSAIGAFNMEHSTEIMEIIGNIYQNPELIEVK